MKKVKDYYYKKAKKEGYSARSAYKLKEINQKKNIIKYGQKILELGASPGSWSEYASKIVGEKGLVLGIDLKPRSEMKQKNLKFIQGDVYDIPVEKYLEYANLFSGIISDMAPNTTGNKVVDHLSSVALCEHALYLSLKLVKTGGYLLVKIFQGSDFQNYIKELRKYYDKVAVIKPKSSRKESKEIFILASNKKANLNSEL